jgi:hypothetical protein
MSLGWDDAVWQGTWRRIHKPRRSSSASPGRGRRASARPHSRVRPLGAVPASACGMAASQALPLHHGRGRVSSPRYACTPYRIWFVGLPLPLSLFAQAPNSACPPPSPWLDVSHHLQKCALLWLRTAPVPTRQCSWRRPRPRPTREVGPGGAAAAAAAVVAVAVGVGG